MDSSRSFQFLLIWWLTSWVAFTAGCYQHVPAPDPEAAIERLVPLLTDPDPTVRLTAAEALGKIGNQKATSFLLSTLHDSETNVREAAAKSLGGLSASGPEVETALVTLLSDPVDSVRRTAAQALGTGERSVALTAVLADLLGHSDPRVRQAAGHALLLIEGHKAFAALAKSTTDNDPAVRQWVLAALGETGDARARPMLLERLRHDPAPGVRAEAAYRLRYLAESSVEQLDSIIKAESNLDVKRWLRKALVDSGSGSAPVQRVD
jgi:HEAT repeat protein